MKQKFLKTIFLSVLTLASLSVNAGAAADTAEVARHNPMAYSGYQGGMMLHAGYVRNYGSSRPINMSGAAFGIGGSVRVKFGKHLRLGSEGYVSVLRYDRKLSYAKIGWGGILLDSHWQFKRWAVFVGGAVGGGGYTHVNMHDRPDTDIIMQENEVSFSKYPFMVIDPFVGTEFTLTKRIAFVLKLDYMLNVTTHVLNQDFTTGPRLFIGIMFGH